MPNAIWINCCLLLSTQSLGYLSNRLLLARNLSYSGESESERGEREKGRETERFFLWRNVKSDKMIMMTYWELLALGRHTRSYSDNCSFVQTQDSS